MHAGDQNVASNASLLNLDQVKDWSKLLDNSRNSLIVSVESWV